MTGLTAGTIPGRHNPGTDGKNDQDEIAPRRRAPRWLVLVAALVVLLGAGTAVALPRVQRSDVTVTGLDDGALLNASAADQFAVAVSTSGFGAGAVTATLDGVDLPTQETGPSTVVRPTGLADGDHVIVVSVSGKYGAKSTTITRHFIVDSTGPTFTAPNEVLPAPTDKPLVITGLVDDATSITVAGLSVPIDRGSYRAEVHAVAGPIDVVATDSSGNTTTRTVTVTDAPTPSVYPATNGVHVGQSAWADPVRRAAILDLARNHQINAVELDIKDEVGDLGYPSKVPLATAIGAKMSFYDAREAIDDLHGLGVKVVGRIVCFLDPTLARWALANGKGNYLVYDGSGTTPLKSKDYGDASFTNFADPDVQQYQIDLAKEAVGLGFDEIIYDYVRRPEGALTGLTFPGLATSHEVGIARFVQHSAEALHPLHAKLGLSVFGIAATRPTEIAQDIRLLAPLVDYIAPMVYPQVWAKGEYGIDRPNRHPYDIVVRSLADFHQIVRGTGAAVVPWLQDYTFGSFEYTDTEVAAQVQATKDSGANGYFVWNAKALYHGAAILPIS